MYIDWVLLPHWITLQPVLQLPAAALAFNTGSISKTVVPIFHLDTKLSENKAQAGKS